MFKLSTIMRPISRVIPEDTPLREALRSFEIWNVSGAPVTADDGELIGFLSQWLIVERHSAELDRPAKEVMTPFLFTLSPDTDLQEALTLLCANRIHRVLVSDPKTKAKGVVSTMDIIRSILVHPGTLVNVLQKRVGKMMSSPVYCVYPSSTLAQFEALCSTYFITGAPVLDPQTQEVVGMVSQSAVARHLWSTGRSLEQSEVLDVMSPLVCKFKPEDKLSRVLDSFVEHDLHRVVVVEERRVVGILTTLDVMQALLRSLLGQSISMAKNTGPMPSWRTAGKAESKA